jgi:signal transduction histidine kinase
VLILNRLILRKLWNPFYETIVKIKQYKLDKEIDVTFSKTGISEFQELNQSVQELIHNNLLVYQNQKHFIENAAHEMQTPVGLIQSKIELLMEEPNINKEQALLIDDINEHIHRLSRLNSTLLLLSKIETNQFPENSQVNISACLLKCCEQFSELLEFKHLTLEVSELPDLYINMNEDLAVILFSNLIKNAINHNYTNGYIYIQLIGRELIISNTGRAISFDPKLLFERFNKRSDHPQSNGLGLSIVKKICALYHFKISYTYTHEKHVLTILF